MTDTSFEAKCDAAIVVYLDAEHARTPIPLERWIEEYATTAAMETALRDFHRTHLLANPRRQLRDTMPASFGERYRFIAGLEPGGMAAVYVVHDKLLRRHVAMKVPQLALAQSAQAVTRFLAEAQIAAQLEHQNIVPVYDSGLLPCGRPYLTMQLVGSVENNATNLASAIRQYHAKPTPEGLTRLIQSFGAVCNAVAFAHTRGVLHRDLKPANVLMGQPGETLLTDWGLSREGGSISTLRSGELSQAGTIAGTLAYMAPEQANAQELSPAADVFGLGAILCTILTGQPPYMSDAATLTDRRTNLLEQARSARMEPIRVRLRRSGTPKDLQRLTIRCLDPDPKKRPENAAAVAAAIAAYQAKLQGAELRLTRVRWRFAAVVVLVLVIAGVSWFLLDRDHRARMTEARIATTRDDVRLWEEAARADRWPEARAALERALGRSSPDDPADLRESLQNAQESMALVRRLDVVRQERIFATGERYRKWGEGYSTVFRDAGYDFAGDPSAADRIAASPIKSALLMAMDDWATFATDDAQVRVVLEAARRADPDPEFRDRLRDPTVRDDREQLRRLAAEAVGRELPVAAAISLGVLLREKGEDSLPILRRAYTSSPADVIVNLEIALSASYQMFSSGPLNRSLRANAVAHCRAALAAAPENPAASFMLAEVLVADRRSVEAEPHARRAVAMRPDLPRTWAVLGFVLSENEKLPEAVDALQNGLRRGESAEGRNMLASILRRLHRPNEAWKVFETINSEDASNRELPTRTELLLEFGKLGDAANTAEQAVRLNPLSPKAYWARALVAMYRSDMPAVAAASREMIRLDPESREGHKMLSLALSRLGHLDEAEAEARTAIALGADGEAQLALGLVALYRGKFAEAQTALGRARASGELTMFVGGVVALFEFSAKSYFDAQKRVPAYAAGAAAPIIPAEAAIHAELCLMAGDAKTALRLFDAAFAWGGWVGAIPSPFEGLSHRLNAARAAVLASKGSPNPAALRDRALGWLRTEVDAHRPSVAWQNPTELRLALNFCKHAPDFEPVRDPAALAKLSADERARWQQLWHDIDDILDQVQKKTLLR